MTKYFFLGILMFFIGKLSGQILTIHQSIKEHCVDTSSKESRIVMTITNNTDRDRWFSLNDFEFAVFDFKGDSVDFSGRHPRLLVDVLITYSLQSDAQRRNNFILIKHNKPTNLIISTNLFNELFFRNLNYQYVLHAIDNTRYSGPPNISLEGHLLSSLDRTKHEL